METIFNNLKNLNNNLIVEFQDNIIDVSHIVDLVENTMFEIDKIEFIYDKDLILSLKLKNKSEDFFAEVRFLTHEEIVTDIYFYRV